MPPQKLHAAYQSLRSANGHQGWWPGETPFEIIIGAILTQNTAWINVEKAIANLKKSGLLIPKKMAGVSKSKLAACIRPAGYFNVKADRIRNFIKFLFSNYKGSLKRMFATPITELREQLLGVNGIGPETADSILLYAGEMPIFVIDAYTKRIFSRHGTHDPAADYHSWQNIFMKALPRDKHLYNDFHAQIVHTGKHYCRPTPLCEKCPLRKYL